MNLDINSPFKACVYAFIILMIAFVIKAENTARVIDETAAEVNTVDYQTEFITKDNTVIKLKNINIKSANPVIQAYINVRNSILGKNK